jgi:hypothetical protein
MNRSPGPQYELNLLGADTQEGCHSEEGVIPSPQASLRILPPANQSVRRRDASVFAMTPLRGCGSERPARRRPGQPHSACPGLCRQHENRASLSQVVPNASGVWSVPNLRVCAPIRRMQPGCVLSRRLYLVAITDRVHVLLASAVAQVVPPGHVAH